MLRAVFKGNADSQAVGPMRRINRYPAGGDEAEGDALAQSEFAEPEVG